MIKQERFRTNLNFIKITKSLAQILDLPLQTRLLANLQPNILLKISSKPPIKEIQIKNLIVL